MATISYQVSYGETKAFGETARNIMTTNFARACAAFDDACELAKREDRSWTVVMWESVPNVPRKIQIDYAQF